MITGKQKKFIRKNIKKLSLDEIARNINLPPKEVEDYLKNIWRKDKFTKFHREVVMSDVQSTNHQTLFGNKEGLKFWFKNNWYIILGLIVLVFGIYANGFNAGFVSDDINWIPKNPNIGNISMLLGWPPNRPLAFFILFLAHAVGGLNPIIYRLPNVFMHAGCAVAIFILINIMINRKTAIFTSLIFAVHPILVESVTWIAGGSQAGLGLTFLLSFITYILSKKHKKLYILSFIFFLMSMLFSEKAVSLILIFPLYEMAFGSLRKNWGWIPYICLGMGGAALLFWQLGGRISGLQTYNYVQPGFDNPLIKIPMSVSEYLRLIFWPNNLSLYRPDLSISWLEYYIRLGVTLLPLIIAGIAYWRPIFGKFSRHFFFWPLFFFIALLPTLTPLRFASSVAERYVYLGSLGIFVLIGILLSYLSEKVKSKSLLYFVFAVIIIALSVRTIVRNQDWQSEDTLWIASAKVAPNNPNVLLNLADMYTRHEEYQKAIDALTEAIQIKPNYGDAYNNIANAQVLLYNQNKNQELVKEAISNYLSAVKYNPLLWQSYQSLGYVYYDLKMYDKAVEYLDQAIRINSSNTALQYNLGLVYLNSGQNDKAKVIFSNILKVDPTNQDAANALKQISSP